MFKVFAIYDSKAEGYLNPFFQLSRGQAIRAFQAAAHQEGHDFNRFSADFTLFEFGDWEPKSGHFNIHEHPMNLGTAADFITTRS